MAAGAERVSSPGAPAPIGPYSQAIRVENLIICSGQIGIDPSTGSLAGADPAVQARRALENVAAVLSAAGAAPRDVVKTTLYLVDMADFAAVNAVYGEFFGNAVPPARSTVAVAALPLGARVEIEAMAYLGRSL